MKKIFSTLAGLATVALAQAQNRFPKPDFESGYQYPDLEYAIPDETLWNVSVSSGMAYSKSGYW